jgi:excisionase family DNA binding protein
VAYDEARVARLYTREGQERKQGARWHRDWDACTDCGRTTRPHHSGGRCTDCARGARPATATLTCTAAARLVGVSAATIQRHIRRGVLAATGGPVGNQHAGGYRIRRDELARWLVGRVVSAGHKRCAACRRLRPLRRFPRNGRKPGGYESRCHACRRAWGRTAQARYRARYPERYAAKLAHDRERRRRWRAATKGVTA